VSRTETGNYEAFRLAVACGRSLCSECRLAETRPHGGPCERRPDREMLSTQPIVLRLTRSPAAT
jgi:hypothetical protein